MPESCEIPRLNASDDEIARLLTATRTVAVVGLSDKPDRDSHRIAVYLKASGYRIIPVNPAVTQVLGEKSYANLKDIPVHVDIVDIFRKPDAVPAIVDEAIAVRAGAVWMQIGIIHNAAADKARAAGVPVVMDRCIMVEHRRLAGAKR